MTMRTVNVLLVEDNEVDQEAVQRAFRRQKIANPVVVARDGVEALDVLRGTGGRKPLDRPFLILLDINLPRMSGIELLKHLRADDKLCDSIVFMLTTSKSENDRMMSYGFNIAGYMVKSDVGAGFIRLIEMLDHYWRVVEFP